MTFNNSYFTPYDPGLQERVCACIKIRGNFVNVEKSSISWSCLRICYFHHVIQLKAYFKTSLCLSLFTSFHYFGIKPKNYLGLLEFFNFALFLYIIYFLGT